MRKLVVTMVAVVGVALAGPAAAVSLWYGDVYTSSLLGDVHARITLPAEPDSIAGLLGSADLDVLGAGLGGGKVAVGSPITLTHTFAPGTSVGSIEKAALVVSVLDDVDLGYETVEISVEQDLIDAGKGRFLVGLFGGSVAALITNSGDSIGVTIASLAGDFQVAFSALAVQYASDTTPTPAIPEPTAALVFAAGLVLAARRR